MKKLVVVEFVALDGVVQAPGHPDEDREGGFEHGGWQQPYTDEVLGKKAAEGMATTDTYLFGRKTYEGLASYWPTAPEDDPIAQHLNPAPKYVVSSTLEKLEWENSRLLEGDIPTAVAELKQSPGGNIAVLGSAQLVATLMEHDLVDEYRLFVAPIVIGSGKKLFRDSKNVRQLKLVDSGTTSVGGLMLGYEPVR